MLIKTHCENFGCNKKFAIRNCPTASRQFFWGKSQQYRCVCAVILFRAPLGNVQYTYILDFPSSKHALYSNMTTNDYRKQTISTDLNF